MTTDGLMSVEISGEFSQPSACRDSQGRLWFATATGLAVVDPSNLPDETNAPPVILEELRANGSLIASNLSGEPSFPQGKREITLAPGAAHIVEITYTACSFRSDDKLRFKYRLHGLSDDWIDAGQSRHAYYANLQPGRYRFEVLAGNKYGVWSQEGARLAFYVAPQYYQTVWFRSFSAAVALSLGFAFYRYRVANLRRLQHLEQQVALARERERLAKDLHDGVGANLTELALLANVEGLERPDPKLLEDRLRKVSLSTRETLRAVRDIIWATTPRGDTLEALVTHICSRAESFLSNAGLQCRFDIPTEIPERHLTGTLRQNIVLALREALTNVVRHAEANSVMISLSLQATSFSIIIQDNGCGFTEAAFPRRRRDLGNGLSNIRARLSEAGGTVNILSAPGEGTRIEIIVPN